MGNNIIPKVIHYCWFGGKPLPILAEKCIASWKKYLPDYEIKRWDESNFDVNIIPYTKEAYDAKKYAFVSDFARFWILYNYGGIYFDTDVEVIQPMDDIIAAGPFMGCEKSLTFGVNPGLGIGTYNHNQIYKELLDLYSFIHFKKEEGRYDDNTIVQYTTNLLMNKGLQNKSEIQSINGIAIYPPEYFSPKSYQTGKISITKNTRTVHHFSGSWVEPTLKQKCYKFIFKILGFKTSQKIYKIKRIIKTLIK